MKRISIAFLSLFLCVASVWSMPRPEYPRPQFERADWVNLNGEWTCSFDFGGSGMEREFYKSNGFDKKITVPFCPESKLSGIGYTDFINHFWYQRPITIPQEWNGKNILLNFGAVYYKSEVYIDGVLANRHFGGTSSFAVDITSLVKPGQTHSLVVYVENDVRGAKQAAGKQNLQYASYGCNYTRTTGILLKHFEIQNKMQSHHKFNEHKTVEQIAARIKGGENIALVSDAGTPAISDPGFMLVRECVRQGVDVECLPGATAFVPALVASGLPNEKFCFEGFLPQKKGRQTRLKELALEYRTIIFYESPFRLLKTLTQFAEFFGTDRQVSVSREISKLHEETVRGSLEEVIQHFTVNEPRGEIVIVLAGLKDKKDKETEKDV